MFGELSGISAHLYRFEDTCNVYLLRDGPRALAVDFGAGGVTALLGTAGVQGIDWILHTHHHRDQCQGDEAAVRRGTRIAAPCYERPLFDDVERFWDHRRLVHNYSNRNTFFTLTRSVPVHAELRDYEEFSWRGFRLKVLPTPGHTLGSVSLLAEVDGRRVAFTGDLLTAGARLPTLHDLQASYLGLEGVDLAVGSLLALQREEVDLILPSHGPPVEDPQAAIDALIGKLTAWHRWTTGRPCSSQVPLAQVSQHLVHAPQACANFYAILDGRGHALLVDYGAASETHFYAYHDFFEPWERQRFVEHSLAELEERHGVRRVDAVFVTHWHDDHVGGVPHLRRRYGSEVWALEGYAEILEHPERHNLNCLFPDPVRVHRVLQDGEELTWRGLTLSTHHLPSGHTDHHGALLATLDGTRVLFSGDAVWETDGRLDQNVIFRNRIDAESQVRCARQLLALEPDVLAPGHGGRLIPAGRTRSEAFLARSLEGAAMLRRLADPALQALAFSPHAVRVEPYRCRPDRHGRARVEVVVEGAVLAAGEDALGWREILVRPAPPPGWTCTPAEARCTLDARGEVRLPFLLAAAPGAPAQVVPQGRRRMAWAVDVTADGRRLGEIAEAVLEIGDAPRAH